MNSNTVVEEIVETPRDNIAEDNDNDEYLAQLIKDVEDNQCSFPSVADLYMQSLETKKTNKYFDDFDEYEHQLPTDRVLDGVGETNKSTQKTIHPSTAGYGKFYVTSPSRKNTKERRGRGSSYVVDYLDDCDDLEDINRNMEDAIDGISDNVESIRDCVRSTERLVNDLYEKQLATNDAVGELQAGINNVVLRTAEINCRVAELESAQKHIMENQERFSMQMEKIMELLRAVATDVKNIRYAGVND